MKAYFSKFIKSPAAAASGKIKNCLAKLIKSPVAVVSVVAVVVFALGLWIGSGFTANDHATNLQSQAPQSAASTNVSPSSVSTPKHSATQWVWVVTTGARYHLTPECSNMKTPIQIGLDEAVGLGYTPCKNCC